MRSFSQSAVLWLILYKFVFIFLQDKKLYIDLLMIKIINSDHKLLLSFAVYCSQHCKSLINVLIILPASAVKSSVAVLPCLLGIKTICNNSKSALWLYLNFRVCFTCYNWWDDPLIPISRSLLEDSLNFPKYYFM